MKNLYMRRWVLVLLMIGLGLPGLASYTSNSVSGSFDDPAVWSPSPVPSEKYRTITIVSGAILYKEGSFSWDAKVTIQQNAKFTVGSGFSTGYGGIDIFGELDVNGKLSGSNDGAAFNVKNGAVVTVNGVADKTNITVENGGVLIVNGDFSLSQTLTINQGGSVIINGNFLNGVVKNYGSFVVNGNYTNNQGDGVTVEKNAVLEIFGDLTASTNINVKVGGTLIVHGNLTSSNAGITSHGDIIVVGNFSTASSTTVEDTGNLVVGGNFTHLDGRFTVNGDLDDTKIYILNPDAEIIAPTWSVVNTPGVVGDLDDFLQNENGSLVDIVNDVIINVVIGYQWKTDVSSSNWKLANNWTGNRIPTSTSNVRIKPCTGVFPEIKKEDGIIEIKDLTIEAGATLTLKPGARLTVNGKLTIAAGGNLVMEHKVGQGGMSSLITKGTVSGNIKTSMELPQDQWFYLGSSKKNAKFSDFGAGTDGVVLNVHRSNAWWAIKSSLASKDLRTLEGVATNFLPLIKDANGDGSPDKRIIQYEGLPNTDVVSRTFDEAGFHLLANPFTSFIDWQDGAGWERANVDHTIWYRTKIGEEMTFVTYNNSPDVANMARIAISPYSLGEITPEIVEEHSKIAPMQAVWIKTLSPNASVNLYPESRNHGTAISRLKGSSESGNVIRIEAENKFSRDGAVIFFKDGFTEGKDNGDSEKYFNDSKNIPEVFTRSSAHSLAISGLPRLTEDYRAIPLSVKNRVEGSVTLKFDLRYFDNEYTAYLEDRDNGTYINLLQNNSYTYSVVTLGEVHDRFVVHLHKITTGIEEVLPEQGQTDGSDFIKIRSLGDKVLVSVSAELIQNGPGVIEVYSIDGRKISEIPAASSRTFLILPQERGIYIVRVNFGRYVKSERVINSTR